jgi:membrane associated rhomboid family serine protease
MDYNFYLIVIILLNVIITVRGLENLPFFRKYEFHMGSVRSGEQFRIVTSGFLHVDIPHLAFNMLTLYFFAPIVYSYLGSYCFVLIYFASLIFGSLCTVYFRKDEYNYRAVGASGAVTGIVYSAILLEPRLQIYGFIPGYIFGIIYLLYSLYGMKSNRDNIGHTAHIGGAIGGYIVTLIEDRALFFNNSFTIIVLAVPILVMAVLAKQKKI